MLTAEQMNAMTPEERTQLFDAFIARLYPGENEILRAANAMGYAKTTVYRWRRENATPMAALMLLQEWDEQRRADDAQRQRNLAADEFRTLLQQQIEVSKTLERILSLLSDAPRGS